MQAASRTFLKPKCIYLMLNIVLLPNPKAGVIAIVTDPYNGNTIQTGCGIKCKAIAGLASSVSSNLLTYPQKFYLCLSSATPTVIQGLRFKLRQVGYSMLATLTTTTKKCIPPI